MRRQSGNFNKKHSENFNNSNRSNSNQNNNRHTGNRRLAGNFTLYPAGCNSYPNKPRTVRPTPDMDIVNVRPVYNNNYYNNSSAMNSASASVSANAGASFDNSFHMPGPSQSSHMAEMHRRSDREAVHHRDRMRLKELSHYICPNCSQQYDYVCRNNRCTGRVPLVLACQHTVCEDCLYKLPSNSDSIKCPVCEEKSKLDRHSSNLQDSFQPNFYLLGLIFWSKLQSTRDPRSLVLTMTPTESTLKNRRGDVKFQMSDDISKCGYVSCSKTATVYCDTCGTCFCDECFTNIHKSVQALCNHKPTPIHDISISTDLMLNRCKKDKHCNMPMEYHCGTCDIFGCCHCIVNNHSGHTAQRLSYLDDEETTEMESLKEQSEEKLKRLLLAHKKFKEITVSSVSTKIDKEIASFFLNFHAKLHDIQKRLHEKLADSKTSPFGLGSIGVSINTSINRLKQLLSIDCSTQPINQRLLLEKLREASQVPCYLVGSTDGEIVRDNGFTCDINLKQLEDLFKLDHVDNFKYTLVNADELPEDHEVEDVQTDQLEAAVSSLLKKKKVSSSTSEDSFNYNYNPLGKAKKDKTSDDIVDKEQVYITYINSLDCFYIQLKKKKSAFNKLCKDIDAYAKKHPNDHPTDATINDLVLANNTAGGKQQEWCRARVINKYEGEETGDKFEVFFIDYGYTKILPVSSLLNISQSLKLLKPFAIECQLYHPNSSLVWTKNAQIYMGKFIDKKEVFIYIKSQNNNVYVVDLYVTSSDGNCLSVLDVLIHTFSNVVSESEDGCSTITPVSRKGAGATLNKFVIYPNSKKFKAGQNYRVILACINSPDELYVHMLDYMPILADLKVALERAYKRGGDVGCVPIENTFALVEYADVIRGNYHRALIESVNITDEYATAVLVDWGLRVNVDLANIKLLNEALAKKEALAIKIELADVAPKIEKSWEIGAKGLLVKHLLNSTELKMLVKDVSPLSVALFHPKPTADLCINAQIVGQGYATSTGPLSMTIEWETEDQQKPISNINEENDMVSLMLNKFEDNLADSTENDFNCSGLQQQVEIVRVVDPSRIYIKFLCKYKEEQKLHEELQIHYNDAAVKKELEEKKKEGSCELKEGDLVVVMHKQLNMFCRAMVKEIQDEVKLVYLCDIGDDIAVTDNEIFEIDPYFTSFASVIYKCHLANIKPAGDINKWNRSSTEMLEEVFAAYKSISVTKVREWQPNTTENVAKKSIPVYMWYMRRIDHPLEPPKFEHHSVNYLLVYSGLASKVPKPNIPDAPPVDDGEEKVSETEEKPPSADGNAQDGKIGFNVSDVEDDMKFSLKNKFKPRKPQLEMVTSTKWPDPLPITETKFQGHFTYADCGYVCVRPATLESVYEFLENSMKQHFMQNPPVVTQTDWKPYDMCTILYTGLYYRGSIVNVEDNMATVIMIDFGSYHHVDVTTVFPVIMHTDIAPLVVKTKLHDVNTKYKVWSDEDNKVALRLLPAWGEVHVVGEEDGVLLIEIFSSDGTNINDVIAGASSNFIRLQNQSQSELCDLITNPTDSSAAEELNTTGDDVIVLKVEELELDIKPPQFPLNKRFEVCVKEVLSFNEVTVEVYKPIASENNETKDEETSIRPTHEEIDDLYKEIQEMADSLPDLQKIQVGAIAICKNDGEWSRARILSTDSLACGTVVVQLLDEGNVVSVGCLSIKKMKAEWYNVPAKCPSVRLNVKLAKKNAANRVREGLDSMISSRFFFMEVLRMRDNKPLVNLWEKATEGKLAYHALVVKNLLIVK